MGHSGDYNCAVKRKVREMAIIEGNWTTAKHFFTLPGRECLCVKRALDSDRIDLDTHISFVERDSEDWYVIRDTLRSLGFTNIHGYFGTLDRCYTGYHSPKPGHYRCSSTIPTDVPKIDLAFVDVCGEMTPQIEWWIENRLKPRLAKRAKVAFTFIAFGRYHGYAHHNKGLDKYEQTYVQNHYNPHQKLGTYYGGSRQSVYKQVAGKLAKILFPRLGVFAKDLSRNLNGWNSTTGLRSLICYRSPTKAFPMSMIRFQLS